MKQEQITIKDIARELGVSISTVSRALSNNPLVKPETRAAIQELAKAKNYHPNFTALSLKQRKTKTIGLLIPQVVHEFFAHVIRGIEDIAYDRGYNVLISSSNELYEREKKNAAELLNGRIDGLLACITKNTSDFSHLWEYKDRHIPLVLFDCITDEIDTDKVIVNDEEAGYLATTHLIDKGCKSVGFLGGPESLLINKKRFSGYQRALKENAITLKEAWILHCDSGKYSDGLEVAKRFFLNQSAPDGIFTTTDMLAIGVMRSARLAGLDIPKDLAVVGFSNWEIGEIVSPSLSTIDQRGHEIGKKSIQMLIDRIESSEDAKPTTSMVSTMLIERESSQFGKTVVHALI